MEDILALQRQLAEAQVSTSAAKLSERNCVELVMKLQSLSMIDLIFTRSGREYLTPAQLRKEIADEVYIRGGRVNLIDLPDALNVDLSHIQAAMPDVLADAPVPTKLVHGEVVSDDYLATLAGDIDASLTASLSGVDDVGAIAQRTILPVAVIRKCIAEHLGSLIHATLDEKTGVLRSDAARVRDEAAARGCLRACAAPAALAELGKRHAIPAEIVADVAARMLASGLLRGRVEGTGVRANFVPKVFEDAAAAAAVSKFSSGGFVAVDQLRAMSVSDPDAFASKMPGAVVLPDIIIGPSLLESIESSALEAIANGAWLDVAAALPPEFPSGNVGDVVSLLNHLGATPRKAAESAGSKPRGGKGSAKHKGANAKASVSVENADAGDSRVAAKLDAAIYQGQYLLSKPLLQKCWCCLRCDADERSKHRASRLRDVMAVVGGKGSVTTAGSEPAPDDAEATTAPKKGKARRRKAKLTDAPSKDGASGNGAVVPIEVPSHSDICALLESNTELMELLSSDYLGNAPADTDEVLQVIVERALTDTDGPSIDDVYESAAEAAVAEMEKERMAAKLTLERSIMTGLEHAELYNLTASTLSAVSESAVEDSRAHVMSTICIQTALSVSEYAATAVGIPQSASSGVAGIRDINSRLPPDVANKMRALVSSVAGKKAGGVDEFLAAYDACAESLDLPPRRPLDKKRERATNAALTAAAGEVLSGASATPDTVAAIDALQTSAVLLHARRNNGVVVAVPPSLIPMLCETLENGSDRPQGAREALRALREAVTDQLRKASDSASPPLVSADMSAAVESVRNLVCLDATHQ